MQSPSLQNAPARSRRFLLGILCNLSLLAAAHAQVERAFPMEPRTERGPAGCLELTPQLTEIAQLTGLGRVNLTGVPLSSGPRTLELKRIPMDFSRTRVHVDGRFAPEGLAIEDASLWVGRIAGVEGSDVMLGLSPHGCYGWIDDGQEKVHILPANEDGWERALVLFVTESEMQSAGELQTDFCSALEAPDQGGLIPSSADIVQAAGSSSDLYVAPIAIETDFQLFQVFGSLAAEETYVAMLLAAMHYRFADQLGVLITYPYIGFYTTADDPWTAQDSAGAGCGDVLTEFRNAWAESIPEGAALGHFLSGASLGCGVAWVDVLCNPSWGFSLSCCINGGLSFPVSQGSNTWDFFVMAHELGHNFGSPHTHDYCPPLDTCADNCLGTTQCISNGTNMSYCHGCPGGMSNITTYFHPEAAALMRSRVEASCLESFCQVQPYCTATPNSAWPVGASMDVSGSTSISQNNMTLMAIAAVPGQYGLFYYGPSAVEIAFGDGYRCVGSDGGSIYRLGPPQIADEWGSIERPTDLHSQPLGGWPGAVQPGTTWYFQLWYRDPAAMGSGFNLSRGLAISFCP